MFRIFKAFGLIVVMAVVAFMNPTPSFGESSGNAASIDNVHCSAGEGFAQVNLFADPQASEPVEFSVFRDGSLYDTEHVAPGDTFGVSIGGMSAGKHIISVTADGQSLPILDPVTGQSMDPQEINIVCSTDTMPGVPVVPVHKHKKHHHKHKHHHTAAALPNTGK